MNKILKFHKVSRRKEKKRIIRIILTSAMIERPVSNGRP